MTDRYWSQESFLSLIDTTHLLNIETIESIDGIASQAKFIALFVLKNSTRSPLAYNILALW